jgi:hypothetical protein
VFHLLLESRLKRRGVSEVSMLSKCFNPQCSATFHRMGQGRLFRMDFTEAARKSALPGRGHADQEVVAALRCKSHPVEHFWLCENCAATMTIALSKAGEVEMIPLETAPPRISAVSSRKTQRGREEVAS